MALLTCRDCGARISDLAAACPRCARPIVHAAGTLPPGAVTAETVAAGPARPGGRWPRALGAAVVVAVVAAALVRPLWRDDAAAIPQPPAATTAPLPAVQPPPVRALRSPAPVAVATVATPPVAPAAIPTRQPRALCRDGAYWYGRRKAGTCSHHGGVAQWLDGREHTTPRPAGSP